MSGRAASPTVWTQISENGLTPGIVRDVERYLAGKTAWLMLPAAALISALFYLRVRGFCGT